MHVFASLLLLYCMYHFSLLKKQKKNEHVLQIARWCYGAGVSLQRGVRRPGQERHVLRLVCVWSWLGRWCVPGPRAVQSVRLQLPRRQVCAWPTLHVGSLDSPSSCTSDALAVFQGYVRKVVAVSRETRPCLSSFWPWTSENKDTIASYNFA